MEVQANLSGGVPQRPAPNAPGWAEAKAFEAQFLAEMLAHTGFGQPLGEIGGGSGGAMFSSMLVEQQAKRIVEAGGMGLAEAVWRAALSRAAHA